MNSPVEDCERVLIGKIVGTHALKGVLRVYSHAESGSIFDSGKTVLVKTQRGETQAYKIEWTRPHKKVRLVCLENVDHIDQAQALVGSELYIHKDDLPAIEEGTYYWLDLIGLSVFTVQGVFLGRVEGIIPTGSNDVYVVTAQEGDKKREVLVPAIESVVREIDLDEKLMRVDLPEGLVEESRPAGIGAAKGPDRG